ncbi:uncharacterized protein LOC132172918 [Corylus avellana]|uniref:uncharacterized protein LOC132172918 n=1 Tax=Corylus avellana TaxID=13451 RepID=UPI002869F86C|nr:uncharacterized protein LOC132172918 [Corylus avellana]
MELFVVLARKIWLRRNSVIYGETFLHLTRLVQEAQTSLEEFQRVNNKAQCAAANNSDPAGVLWNPPPHSMIKMNWDAGLNLKEGRVGLGLIARDSNGTVLATRSLSLAIQTESTTAKALATVYAITFCKELGFDNIIYESDSMQVIKTIVSE